MVMKIGTQSVLKFLFMIFPSPRLFRALYAKDGCLVNFLDRMHGNKSKYLTLINGCFSVLIAYEVRICSLFRQGY